MFSQAEPVCAGALVLAGLLHWFMSVHLTEMQDTSCRAALSIQNTKWVYSDTVVLLTPLPHHGWEPTYSQILPVLLLSATLSFLCGKVNHAGDVLFQPKAIAKMADKIHKDFNELFVIKV